MDSSRLTITIPAATADAVNAALVAKFGDIAAGTFSVHPPHPTTPDALDTTVMVCSWDLAATATDTGDPTTAVATIAQTIEQTGKTGSGKTAKTADIKVGAEPATATKVTAAELTATDLSTKTPVADLADPIK
jgi:hypothetical protein